MSRVTARTSPIRRADVTLGANAKKDVDGYLTPQFINKSATGIVTGRKAVTAAGTAERLVASSTACNKVIVCADLGNTNPVVVGDASVVAASGSQQGIVLIPGNDPVTLEVDDVFNVYVDSQTNSDAVCFAYFTI